MGLRQNIHEDPITGLELRELVAVPKGTSVRAAVAIMRNKKLGCCVVVDGQGKPVGKFTERKLMKLLLANPRDMDQPVDRFMYNDADCIAGGKPIADLVEMMKSRRLRFVCVVDDKGLPVALTGQRGLMEYVADHFPRQVKVQRMESKLHMDHREGA